MVRAAAFALTATLSASALAASILSASPAWNGTWKSNPAKSQITGRTLSYAKEGAGFRYTNGGIPTSPSLATARTTRSTSTATP